MLCWWKLILQLYFNYTLTILQNIQVHSHQGVAFWGNNNEGYFELLMELSAKVDTRITSCAEKKQEKYLHHDMQNEIIRLMAFTTLRDIYQW